MEIEEMQALLDVDPPEGLWGKIEAGIEKHKRLREQQRVWAAKNRKENPERVSAQQKKWSKNTDYYENNKEDLKAYAILWKKNNRMKCLIASAKSRAKEKNLPFNITLLDLVIPEFCPIMGTRLQWGEGVRSDSSPSLDRIIPALGYVKGNVQVISWKANRIKMDSTPEELKLVADYMQRIINDRTREGVEAVGTVGIESSSADHAN
jgi:hypothetical protein